MAPRHDPEPGRPGRTRLVQLAAVAGLLVALAAGCTPARAQRAAQRDGRAPTSSGVDTTPARSRVHVVGLGDSVTAGSACDCLNFVQLYATGLERRWRRAVDETNLGSGGLTSTGLLARLQSDDETRAEVRSADVVLMTIGANDLVPALRAWDRGPGTDDRTCGGTCDTSDVNRVGQHIEAALAVVHRLRRGRPTLVLVTTYWNVFEDGDVASADRGASYLAWSDGLTRRLNARITQAALATGATPVDLYAPFKADGKDPTPLLAGDGDHASAAGHEVIASSLLAATPAGQAAPTTS
jgi:lysophospholipase L1-like esterase